MASISSPYYIREGKIVNRELTLMNDIWCLVKPYLPTKERLHLADGLVELFDDYGMSDGIEDTFDIDKDLKVAVVSFYDMVAEDNNDDDQWS